MLAVDIEVQKVHSFAIDKMYHAFQALESATPPPRMVETISGPALRYSEKLPSQALIQKLARYLSGVKAINVLLDRGLLQEQGAIQRILDEIGDDISFICLAVINDDWTDRHKVYLDAFWAEEFDHPEAIKSTQRRAMVKRRSIRAYINRAQGLMDPSTADAAGRVLHSVYSGYIHAASPQIMDMCRGFPPRFQVLGITDRYLTKSYTQGAWNYFYRGLMYTTMIATASGNAALVDELHADMNEFERLSKKISSIV